jgi:nucleotide-binding universal stress UspA family protein
MIKRILVVLGGSRFMDSVVQTSLDLAERHGATLTGCAVVDESLVDPGEATPVGGGGASQDAREQRLGIARTGALEATHRFEEACQARGITHTAQVLEGDSIEVLREAWRFQDVGVIGVREIFNYGAVEHDPEVVVRLINHGVRPLIAVDSRVTRMERVLVAFNGSAESAKALKHWTMNHAAPEVTVRVVTCGDDCSDQDLQQAEDYIRAHGVAQVEHVRLEGDAGTALLADGEAWGADLIVAGSTGRNWLSRMVIGDTARELVENTNIALFMLH